MAVDLLMPLERLGFADITLWMISFALVYGLMSQAKVPKDKAPRAIIGFVVSFMVLLATPGALLTTITNLGTGLLVVLLGIIMLMVFVEAGGVKHYVLTKGKDEKGKDIEYNREVKLFQKTPLLTAAVLIVVAIVLFLGAGGLSVANIQLPIDPLGAAFLAMVALAVVWLVVGGQKKED